MFWLIENMADAALYNAPEHRMVSTDQTAERRGPSSADIARGAATRSDEPVSVQILGFNDFHGHLEPPSGGSGRISVGSSQVDAGGAAYFAAHLERLRLHAAHSLTVSAGDLVGGSPLPSAVFHDEPTVRVMDSMGLDFNAVGNHEFDEGQDELQRLQYGGCHPNHGCQYETSFDGASFKFLAANVATTSGETLFPGYAIREFAGVKIAVVGMTLKDTPGLVSSDGIQGLSFLDEVATVERIVPELQSQGVDAIIVAIHEGGFQAGSYDGCDGISGPIVDIVNHLPDAVDVVVTGHTHEAYLCTINDKLVSSAASYGRLITDIELQIVPDKGVVSAGAKQVIVSRDLEVDSAVQALVAAAVTKSGAIGGRVVGQITKDLSRAPSATGHSELGMVVADAQLYATQSSSAGGAQVAFANLRGLRDDLTTGTRGEVTYADVFSTHPFGNAVVTVTLTGEEMRELLEQHLTGSKTVLQPSSGFTYVYDGRKAPGLRVALSSMRLDGEPVDGNADYRVALNSFLADGGEGCSVLLKGRERLQGPVDADALAVYLKERGPIGPPEEDRVEVHRA